MRVNRYFVYTMADGAMLAARFRVEDPVTCRMSPIQFATEMGAARYEEISRETYWAMRRERKNESTLDTEAC